jgi:deazaflavin-dependent oxidoreductase (nitroreductase family)
MDYRAINAKVIEQFRRGEEIEGMHRERLVLLTTTGRKTGRPHTTPMMFHRDADRLLVVAANAGSVKHPEWYLNIEADPHVIVEVDDERYPALAEPAEGAERDRLWPMLKETYHFFAEYDSKVERDIPVVILTRAENP